jgi:hypothetical protein
LWHRRVTERHIDSLRLCYSIQLSLRRQLMPVDSISVGAFGALDLVPVAAMGGTEDVGRGMGIINTVRGLATLCGPPLGGLLVSTNLGYKAVGYFAGRSVPDYLTVVC